MQYMKAWNDVNIFSKFWREIMFFFIFYKRVSMLNLNEPFPKSLWSLISGERLVSPFEPENVIADYAAEARTDLGDPDEIERVTVIEYQ